MKYTTLFFLFFITFSNAQEFYICNFKNTTNISSIRHVDENFNVTNIIDVNINAGILLDITLDAEGKMYGITHLNTIIEIDLSNGFYNELYFFPGGGNYNNLVYDHVNNELITINFDTTALYRFNLDSLTITAADVIGVNTPGDLTYYKGNLIFQDADTSNIVTYDGNEVTTIACSLEVDYFGFSNFVTNCDDNIIYAFQETGYIYEFDIEANSYDFIGDILDQTDLIYGSTSINEYLASSCTLELLEEVDCNLSISDENILKINLSPNPTSGKIFIDNIHFSEKLYYSIYTIEGKKLKSSIIGSKINIENLSAGIYIIHLHNKSGNISLYKKIVKK